MKIFHVLTGSLLLLASCGPHTSNSYTIKGSIEGLPDSVVIVLSDYTSGAGVDPIAEVVAVNGKFEINGESPEPRMVILGIKDNYGSKMFMLENGEIVLEGTTAAEESRDGKNFYSFAQVSVSGSASHEEYLEKTLGRRQIDSAITAYQHEYRDLHRELQSFKRNDPRVDSIKATERYQKMSQVESSLFAALDSNYRATVAANKDTYWGPLLMCAMVTYVSPSQRDMYEQFSDSAKNSFYGRHLYNLLYPVGRPGDKMPEFKATTVDGNEVDLYDFCQGKKAVLLDFWASWCGPCRREIPNLKEIYKKNADKGFEILSISIDADEEPWLKAVKDEDLKWTNVRDTDHSIADLYKVTAVPTMYVIDGNGCLVAENLRGEELAAKIGELLD